MIQSGAVELASSTVLEYENSRNPQPDRREWVARCAALAVHRQTADAAVHHRADELARRGLTALDALHVACAEAAGSHYCVTCDDRLIARCRDLTLRVVNPGELVREITGGAE